MKDAATRSMNAIADALTAGKKASALVVAVETPLLVAKPHLARLHKGW